MDIRDKQASLFPGSTNDKFHNFDARVPQQGTFMTKGDRWISFSSPQDMREKVMRIFKSVPDRHFSKKQRVCQERFE